MIEPEADWYVRHLGSPVPDGFEYRSDTNAQWLTEEQLGSLIDEIRGSAAGFAA